MTVAPAPSCPGGANGVFIHLNTQTGVLGTTASFAQGTAPYLCLVPTPSVGIGDSIERLADFDGDGLTDFFIRNSDGGTDTFSRIVLTRTSGTSLIAYETRNAATLGLTNDEKSRSAKRVAHWMDINSDGLDDLVFAQSESTTATPANMWVVRLNRGGTLSAAIATGSSSNAGTVGTAVGLQATSNGTLKYANRLPQMDWDGDGHIDLLKPRGFAARICSFIPTSRIIGSETCDGAQTQSQCATYMCPEDPVAGYNFPGSTRRREYGGKVVMPMYAEGWGDFDSSSYTLDALRFVQTGPATVVVQVVPTSLSASLDRQAPEDTYGDSAPDLVTTAGCRFSSTGFENIPGGHAFENETPCLAVWGSGLGPEHFIDPEVTVASLQGHYKTFINEGSGLVDLAQDLVNGLGESISWRYISLAFPTPAWWLALDLPEIYSIPSTNRYVDDRHYYFTSTMPVVQAMTRSTAAQNKPGVPVNGSRSFFYGYTEAMYNRLGRGFQGFRSITALDLGDENRSVRSKTTFHQKFPLTSKVESVLTTPRNRPSLPIAQETNDWRCGLIGRVACSAPAVGQTTIVAPYPDKQVSTTYDLATTQGNPGLSVAIGTTTTINAASAAAPNSGWDAWGNLRAQVVTVADASTGGGGGKFLDSGTTSTTNNYTIDTTNWWVNKLDSTSTSSTIMYATNHALPAPCTVGTCTPTRTVSTSYGWNSDRTAQFQTLQPGVPQQEVITSYGYASPTSYGLPTSVTLTGSGATPASRTSTLSYSNDGVTAAADGYLPLAITNDLLQTTTTHRRRRDGQVSRVIDPTNLQTVTQFDAFGRAKQIDYKQTNGVTALAPSKYISLARCIEASGGTTNPIAAWCPSGYGEGTGQDLAVLRTTVVQDGQPTQVTWQDKLGRTVKQATRGLTGAFIQTLTEYDVSGSVERQSAPHFGGSTAYWTLFDNYDQLGRPGKKIAPASEMDSTNGDVVTQYTYTGTKTAIKVRGESSALATGSCPAGVLCMDMARYHDSLGRLVKTVQNDGPTANYATSRYWFDAAGNPVAAQDAEGNVIRGYYDNLGRRTSMTDPDAGTWSFTYDGFGQMLGQTDARGISTTMTYDALGRMTNRTSSNPGGAGLAAESVYDSWSFDPAGGPGQLDVARRAINSAFNQVWKEQYGYNATTRRPETTSTTIAGEASTWVTYQSYDSFGREQVTTYPDGLAVQRNYHPISGIFNQLANANTAQGYWTASAQDAFGNIVNENYGNGVYTNDVSYPSTGQMLFKRWYTSTGAALDKFQYTYDSFGNLKQQQRTQALLLPATITENYQYDGLQRLTQSSRVGVPGAMPINTSYSPSGNLQKKSDNGQDLPSAYLYGYNGCGPHAVAVVYRTAPTPARSYGCDQNGNVVAGNEISAVYDFMNLPRIINRIGSPHPGSTQFRYDANGQRYEEVTGSGETTRFGPKGYEKVTGTSVGAYARHRHELGPVIVSRTNGVDDITYVGRDRLGSTASVLPFNPYKGDLRSYDPFGNPRQGNFDDNGKTTEAGRLELRPITARGFTGHEHIDEGRVIHMNGRVYDYALGRFLGPDPIIQFPTSTQSLNPYSYIMNNPFAGTDPSGYSASDEELPESGTSKTFNYTATGSHIAQKFTAVGNSKGGVDVYRGSGPSNGNDSMTSKGASSMPRNSGSRAQTDKVGSDASKIAHPTVAGSDVRTGRGGSGSKKEYEDLASAATRNVKEMISLPSESKDEFDWRVRDVISAYTEDTGNEYRSAFSSRTGGGGVMQYGAQIQTSDSPLVSAATSAMQSNGWKYDGTWDQHSHGFIKRGYTYTALDVAYLRFTGSKEPAVGERAGPRDTAGLRDSFSYADRKNRYSNLVTRNGLLQGRPNERGKFTPVERIRPGATK